VSLAVARFVDRRIAVAARRESRLMIVVQAPPAHTRRMGRITALFLRIIGAWGGGWKAKPS
jgi:hypothetical protein